MLRQGIKICQAIYSVSRMNQVSEIAQPISKEAKMGVNPVSHHRSKENKFTK